MGDSEQGLWVQEWVQLVHYSKVYKSSPALQAEAVIVVGLPNYPQGLSMLDLCILVKICSPIS